MKKIFLIIGIMLSACFAEEHNKELVLDGQKAHGYLLKELRKYWNNKDYQALSYIVNRNLELDKPDPTLLNEGRFVFMFILKNRDAYIESTKLLIEISESTGLFSYTDKNTLKLINKVTKEEFTSPDNGFDIHLKKAHEKGSRFAPFKLESSLNYRSQLKNPEYIAPEVLQIFKDVEEGKHLENTQLANNQTTKTKINPNLLAANTPQTTQPQQATQQPKSQEEQTAETTTSEKQTPTWLIYALVALGLVILLLVIKKLKNKE